MIKVIKNVKISEACESGSLGGARTDTNLNLSCSFLTSCRIEKHHVFHQLIPLTKLRLRVPLIPWSFKDWKGSIKLLGNPHWWPVVRTQREEAHAHSENRAEEAWMGLFHRHQAMQAQEHGEKRGLRLGTVLGKTTDKHHHTRVQLHNCPPPLPLSSGDPIIYKTKERKPVNRQ